MNQQKWVAQVGADHTRLFFAVPPKGGIRKGGSEQQVAF